MPLSLLQRCNVPWVVATVHMGEVVSEGDDPPLSSSRLSPESLKPAHRGEG